MGWVAVRELLKRGGCRMKQKKEKGNQEELNMKMRGKRMAAPMMLKRRKNGGEGAPEIEQ